MGKVILILIILYASSLSFAEESIIIPKGLKTSFSSGTLYIYNGKSNTKNKNNATLKVDTDNTKIKKVVIRNVRINSHNSRIKSTDEQGAVVKINIGNGVKSDIKNLDIKSSNTSVENVSHKSTGCAAVYCFKTSSKAKSRSENVVVTVTGSNKFTSKVK